MNKIKLGDIIDTQKGYAFKSSWYQKSGIPIVKVSNFTDNSVSKNNIDFISKDIATQYERYSLKSNDVIIVKSYQLILKDSPLKLNEINVNV